MPIILKSGSLNLLEPSGPVQACNGIALPLPHISNDLLDHEFELTSLNYVVSVFYDFGLSKKKKAVRGIYLLGKATITIVVTY